MLILLLSFRFALQHDFMNAVSRSRDMLMSYWSIKSDNEAAEAAAAGSYYYYYTIYYTIECGSRAPTVLFQKFHFDILFFLFFAFSVCSVYANLPLRFA